MVKLQLMHWLGIAAGFVLAVVSWILFSGNLFNFALSLSLFIGVLLSDERDRCAGGE